MLDLFFEICRYARETDKMTYLDIMNIDIEEYLDYLDYQALHPIKKEGD